VNHHGKTIPSCTTSTIYFGSGVSIATEMGRQRHVRFPLDSDQTVDIARSPLLMGERT
jgi:hypothetical protein